jgi:hypothetical protein
VSQKRLPATIMSSSTSIPTVPVTGIFADPSLSLRLNIKTANKSSEPTLIGTAVGLLQQKMAVQISETFQLVPAVSALDMEAEPTTFPAGMLPSNI